MNQDELDDFGFTFSNLNATKASADDKVQGLRKMIMPLLNNLKNNPEKDTIVWPDRVKKIDAFIEKMDKYIDS